MSSVNIIISVRNLLELVWLLHLSEMSQQFVEDYMFWLLTKKECSHNTSTKWLKNFKKIILLSLAKGWLMKDPFAEYKFTLEAIDRDFLEDSEIQGILSKKNKIARLDQVQDTFIFLLLHGACIFGITKTLTMHKAWRSVSTNIYLAGCMKILEIMRLTGHLSKEVLAKK